VFDDVGASEALLSELNDLRSDANDRRAASGSSPRVPSGPAEGPPNDLADGVGVVALGLSIFDPGIFDLIEPLNDRVDSRVSDLENDGYESRDGPASVLDARDVSLFPPFEG